MTRKSNTIVPKLTINTTRTNSHCSAAVDSKLNPRKAHQTLITDFLPTKPLVQLSCSPAESPSITPIPILPYYKFKSGMEAIVVGIPCKKKDRQFPQSATVLSGEIGTQNRTPTLPAHLSHAWSSLAHSSDSRGARISSADGSISWPAFVSPVSRQD